MLLKKPEILLLIFSLLMAPLIGCAQPPSTPVLASWADQYAAARGGINELGGDFVLAQASALPARRVPATPDEPIELEVILIFESLAPTGDEGNPPSYATQVVKYNDYHLAESLSVGDVLLRQYAPASASLDRASMLQIGPQDALQLTREEGESYMGKQLNQGNIDIYLVWDVSEDNPELKNSMAPAWHIVYYREDNRLHMLIDAQTGTLLERYEGIN